MLKPLHFELLAYVSFGVAAVVAFWKLRDKREYGYALLATSLLFFPYEWLADTYFMVMTYDPGFVMLGNLPGTQLPLMMFFAYGMFWGIPLMLCIRLREKIDAMPLAIRIGVLWAIFTLIDLGIEYTTTLPGLWTYYWPKSMMIGGVQPWVTPLLVSLWNLVLYFTQPVAQKLSDGRNWLAGLGVHYGIFFVGYATCTVVVLTVIKFIGITALPNTIPFPGF
jgi:hypothetical protein